MAFHSTFKFSRSYFSITIIVICVLACQSPEKKSSNNLEGLWSLHIMEQKDSLGIWNQWRNGMQGFLLYDATENMSLHLMDKGYENFDLEFPNFVDSIPLEALQHLTSSYVYFAKYKVDKKNGIVEHARISHSNPKDWGAVVQRRFSFSEDTLILSPIEEKLSSLRLKWVKN